MCACANGTAASPEGDLSAPPSHGPAVLTPHRPTYAAQDPSTDRTEGSSGD